MFGVAPVVAALLGPLARSLRVARRVGERRLDGREGLGEAHLVCVHRCHFVCDFVRRLRVARRQMIYATVACAIAAVWARNGMRLLCASVSLDASKRAGRLFGRAERYKYKVAPLEPSAQPLRSCRDAAASVLTLEHCPILLDANRSAPTPATRSAAPIYVAAPPRCRAAAR